MSDAKGPGADSRETPSLHERSHTHDMHACMHAHMCTGGANTHTHWHEHSRR